MKKNKSVRAIAFYLPQYHPIRENDQWWGKGFTEWTNVVRARPQFPGHYQPHLPADLGFYDLRVPETREAQANLAREYGIHGFCYYHYWFLGKRLLELPVNEILASGKPDFPLCLCWANEHWTRKWDGASGIINMKQEYSPEDDVRHIQSLIPVFQDPRYIRIEGKPLFLVYRTNALPDAEHTAGIWRREAERAGLPGLYLCNVMSLLELHIDASKIGFDASVEFQPTRRLVWSDKPSFRENLRYLIAGSDAHKRHQLRSYERLARIASESLSSEPPFKIFRGVTPGWDNTARQPNSDAFILHGSTPELYGQWLQSAIRATRAQNERHEQLIFVNAWNEWAEGNHLEPDQRWGLRYLEETRKAIEDAA